MKSHGEAFLGILLTIFAFEVVDVWNFGRLEFFVTLVVLITLKIGLLRRFVSVQDELRKKNEQESNNVSLVESMKTRHEDTAIFSSGVEEDEKVEGDEEKVEADVRTPKKNSGSEGIGVKRLQKKIESAQWIVETNEQNINNGIPCEEYYSEKLQDEEEKIEVAASTFQQVPAQKTFPSKNAANDVARKPAKQPSPTSPAIALQNEGVY